MILTDENFSLDAGHPKPLRAIGLSPFRSMEPSLAWNVNELVRCQGIEFGPRREFHRPTKLLVSFGVKQYSKESHGKLRSFEYSRTIRRITYGYSIDGTFGKCFF